MISSEETDQGGESVSRCLKEDLTHSFEVVLKDLPEVLTYIKRLNEHIEKQQCTLVKLYKKLKEYKLQSSTNLKSSLETHDACTQTDPPDEEMASLSTLLSQPTVPGTEDQCSEWSSATGAKSAMSIAEEVKKVAENAMQQTGFVYEETSGMYYDYNTGYYYNAEMGLYYEGNSGTYLYYNEETKTYEYHSHAAVPQALVSAQPDSSTHQTALPVLTAQPVSALIVSSPATSTKKVSAPIEPVPVIPEVSTKHKSSKVKPKETKETDFYIPGSNPIAPVLSESSNVSDTKESRHEHKRKGKHKKHKSKKKKKKSHKSHSKSENSLEEGECSDSSGCHSESEIDSSTSLKPSEKERTEEKAKFLEEPLLSEPNIEEPLCTKFAQPWKKRRVSEEATEAWPPCMRIIVQSTEVKNLKVGTLFIVTCKGGTLGREKSHAVSIPDINISKHHGKFTFDEANGGIYYLIDYGSRNGTYVNQQRLSSAKQESEPFEIPHGTIITLGSTDLLCHIHPGRETCEECEPGVVAARKKSSAHESEQVHQVCNSGESKSEKRLQELKRLRKRFGLECNESKSDLLAPGYEDRAEMRRVTVGSQNEHAKTEVASTTESIKSTNKGFKMLSKMGWKEGESLGRDGSGLTEPVLVSQRADKAGLGADNAFAALGTDSRAKHKADKWERARLRYGQLPDTRDRELDEDDDDDD